MILQMDRRPDREKAEVLSEKDLKEPRYNLAHPSVSAVQEFPSAKVAPEDPSRFLAAHNPLAPSRETLPNRTTWSCLRTVVMRRFPSTST